MQFLLMWCHDDDDCRSAANTAVLFSLGDRLSILMWLPVRSSNRAELWRSVAVNVPFDFPRPDLSPPTIATGQPCAALGGMRYRTSVVHGIVVSDKVAHWVAKYYFLPVD